MSQTKSKQGLGEIYEKEYAEKYLGHLSADKERFLEIEDQVKGLWKILSLRLDALANYHYTPLPPSLDFGVVQEDDSNEGKKKKKKIGKGYRSIEVEEEGVEVIPDGVVNTTATPSEIFKPTKGADVNQEEMTQDERKAKYREKKRARRKRRREKEVVRKLVRKVNPGIGNKYAQMKLVDEMNRQQEKLENDSNKAMDVASSVLMNFGSSTAVFDELERQRNRGDKGKGIKEKKKKKNKSKATEFL